MKPKRSSFHPALMMSTLFFTITLLSACPQGGETASPDAGTATGSAETAAPAAESADDGKGVGPVKTVTLASVDPALVTEGKKVFEAKCTSCHKMEAAKYVGPGLKGVTERRKPEWIMNMILNSTEMTQKDPEAKKLFAQYMVQMPNQNIDEKQARAVLEFFRSIDTK